MLVYVLNKLGKPLMPCSPRKARLLLKEKKAKIVNIKPFIIQLKFGSSGYRQEIDLGVDSGSKIIGYSASTTKQEILSGECYLRNDIVRLLSSRRELKHTRRSQKTRYRQPRFLNRVSTKKEGWIAPSIQNKIDTHINVIKKIHRIIPVTKINIETASFDIQKIKDPGIASKEYQEGEQLNFWNVREYVLFRDNHTCQGCKGKSGDKILNVHHIESRKTGGDSPKNLITLCETCHKKHHSGELKLKLKRGCSFRDAAFMGIMRWAVLDKLKKIFPVVNNTYGYITKTNRIKHNLPKSHTNDAFCIAGNFNAKRNDSDIIMRKVRSHDRVLHKVNYAKGHKKIKTRGEYLVHGFRNFDYVKSGDVYGFVTTRRAKGQFVISDILGTKALSVSLKKISFVKHSNNILAEIVNISQGDNNASVY